MFQELAKLFSGRDATDRRAHARKAVQYPARWVKDAASESYADGVGLEISPTGALFALKEKPPTDEFSLQFKLRERLITARVTVLRHDQSVQGGTTWHRFATKFAGIAADDWDAVVRFIEDEPEPDDKGIDEIKAAMRKEDDAFRLLPLAVQRQIVDLLVQNNKLARPADGQAPLLKMQYSGHARHSGVEVHRCNVHSRITIDGEMRQYDTTFLIEAATGKVSVQSSR